MDREQKWSILCVLASSLLFSIGGLCMKLIPWSPLAINGARNLIGAAVIGIYLLCARHRVRFNRPVLIGALSVMGTTTMFTVANKLTTAANAIVIQFTAPAFVILFMLILYRTRPTRLDLTTCALVILGVGLFFLDSLRTGNILGDLAALASGVCYAGVFMMNTSEQADSLSSTFLGQLACGILFTPFCLGETDFSLTPMLALIVLGVFQVGLAYTLLAIGVKRTPAVMASLISGMEPILNPTWVAIFYGETMSPTALVGAVVVIGSILVYNVIKSRAPARKGSAA